MSRENLPQSQWPRDGHDGWTASPSAEGLYYQIGWCQDRSKAWFYEKPVRVVPVEGGVLYSMDLNRRPTRPFETGEVSGLIKPDTRHNLFRPMSLGPWIPRETTPSRLDLLLED